MGADNQSIGSEWRGWGVRMGVVSMMAATGMVLAGQAADATTTMTQSLGTQADGDGQGLPLDLQRLPDGNSGTTCGAAIFVRIPGNLLPSDTVSAGDGIGGSVSTGG